MAATKLGARLRKHRERLGLESQAVAKKIGITPGYYSMIENGQPTHVSDKLLGKIRRTLRITPALKAEQEVHNERNRRYERARRAA